MPPTVLTFWPRDIYGFLLDENFARISQRYVTWPFYRCAIFEMYIFYKQCLTRDTFYRADAYNGIRAIKTL